MTGTTPAPSRAADELRDKLDLPHEDMLAVDGMVSRCALDLLNVVVSSSWSTSTRAVLPRDRDELTHLYILHVQTASGDGVPELRKTCRLADDDERDTATVPTSHNTKRERQKTYKLFRKRRAENSHRWRVLETIYDDVTLLKRVLQFSSSLTIIERKRVVYLLARHPAVVPDRVS